MPTLEARLAALFSDEAPLLRDASTAVVGSRGKRLRPLLLLLSNACYGEITDRTYMNAALVELIHTASLAHDDVVDEADSRRGMPSAPARWGNKFSILLGDFLFARVFELSAADSDPTILRLLAETATAMARAVIVELKQLTLDAEEEIYWQVVRGKTATLYAVATAIGAVLGGASPAQVRALRLYGETFGCAFQLADDLLDLQGSELDRGKPDGADAVQRRATLPVLHVLRTAPPAVVAELQALWSADTLTPDDLTAVRVLLEAHGGFAYGWQTVKAYLEQAAGYLDGVPIGAGRTALTHLVRDRFPLPVMPVAVR
jgi:octaprenyl-diphosphate synthase